MFKVKVEVMLKDDVLDPQGKTVSRSLDHLGYKGLSHMKIGKYIEFMIDNNDEATVRAQVEKMSKEVLSNPVIEKYEFYMERV
ncbi:MAG: phosphoribosylformylglycinamidine synthase subunit PurS [Candidatus Margulisbacteria bacterium]|nr:phosphoribosylformylglycinamidine synthase subunit PurS [Candidatus Margulisiibacteriota bacterium]